MQQHWNQRRRLPQFPQDGQQERHQQPALFTSFHGLLTFSQTLTCFSLPCDNDHEQKALVPYDYEKPTAHPLDACFAHMRQLFSESSHSLPTTYKGTHDSREPSERSLALSVVDRSSAAHASRLLDLGSLFSFGASCSRDPLGDRLSSSAASTIRPSDTRWPGACITSFH